MYLCKFRICIYLGLIRLVFCGCEPIIDQKGGKPIIDPENKVVSQLKTKCQKCKANLFDQYVNILIGMARWIDPYVFFVHTAYSSKAKIVL